jgi:hypothetical protein
MAAIIGAANAFLLTRESRYLDLARWQIDHILSLGEVRDGQLVVPYRHGDAGWFEYQPLALLYPVAVWYLSMDAADWERIERLRRGSKDDWRVVRPFRNKHDDGHEAPWLCFLRGENPCYPEEILRESYGQVCRRMDLIRADQEDLTQVNIHHWQQRNPVLTEALIQLTLGAPQVVYNGGLLMARVRYFDLERRRPGLPLDVAALVENLEAERTVLQLVNTSPFHPRDVVIQAGAFGEHQFTDVRSATPAAPAAATAAAGSLESQAVSVQDTHLHIRLQPGSHIRLDLGTARFVNRPSYALPWQEGGSPLQDGKSH